MKTTYLLFLCACCVVFSSCAIRKQKEPGTPTKAYMETNPPQIIHIDGFSISPKYSVAYDKLLKSGSDTLCLLVNSHYIYYPFGMLKDKSKVNTGLLKGFSVKSKIIKTDIGDIEIKILTYGSSKLMFSNNRTTPGEYYDTDKGEVYDTDIVFLNGIRVGMNIQDFYKIFFESFPNDLITKYKYFVLKSGNDVSHIYSFETGKLKSVKLNSWLYFTADY